MSGLRFGIVMVHYHSEDLLGQCLKALAASTVGDYQVVIVNNGSSKPLGWVERLDPRIKLVESGGNVGFAAASNLALEHLPADIPYLMTLNPDVMVEPTTLELLLERLDQDRTIGIITPRLLLSDGRIDPACHRNDPNLVSAFAKQTGLQRLFRRNRLLGDYNMTWHSRNKAHEVGCVTGAFMLIRREAMDQAGGLFDERFFLYGEDLDLCRRVRNAGWRVFYEPAAWATHVKGSGRIRRAATTIHFHHAMWIYYRKWGFFRRNPLVLGPLAMTIALMGSLEILRTQARLAFKRLSL
ncbi:MAG: glycosyltransferase family 2 protein [Candidatus Sumerlaeia bacterium]